MASYFSIVFKDISEAEKQELILRADVVAFSHSHLMNERDRFRGVAESMAHSISLLEHTVETGEG